MPLRGFHVKRIFPNLGQVQQRLQIAEVGVDPLDTKIGQRAPCAGEQIGPSPRGRIGDQFRQKRIIGQRGLVSRIAKAFHANAIAARRIKSGQLPFGRGGGAILVHSFHGDTQLDRHSARGWGRPCQSQIVQGFASGQTDLGLYQIDPRNFFGDGMFDLKSGVRLDENKAGLIRAHKEFDCAKGCNAGRTPQVHRAVQNTGA